MARPAGVGPSRQALGATIPRNGSYTAFRMEKDYFSKEWDDAAMPNSVFFTQRGHAIHGSYDSILVDQFRMVVCG